MKSCGWWGECSEVFLICGNSFGTSGNRKHSLPAKVITFLRTELLDDLRIYWRKYYDRSRETRRDFNDVTYFHGLSIASSLKRVRRKSEKAHLFEIGKLMMLH